MNTTDVSTTIAPKSDQMNADDLIVGPVTITVTKVSLLGGDQPIAIGYEGDNGKPYKPCKSMRRVMVQLWGSDGNTYIGRSMTLYRDPNVKFGGANVGGIRISHMTDISKAETLSLTVSKAKRSQYVVKPLAASQSKLAEKPELSGEYITLDQSIELGDLLDAANIEKDDLLERAAAALGEKPATLNVLPVEFYDRAKRWIAGNSKVPA
ncbi:MAG: hypothetical protein WAU16_16265 [Rhizobiaceae bacterium]